MKFMTNPIMTSSEFINAGREERRQSPRVKSNKLAKIYLHDAVFVDCIVKDISDHGARLLLANENWTFAEFHIQFVETAMRLKVVKVWKDGTSVGVRFV